MRQDDAARAGDAGRLIQLLHGSLDIIVGFENRVGVQNELDIGIELTRLTFDGWRFSDWRAPLDGDQIDLLQRTERFGTGDRTIRTSIIDENDPPGAERLASDGREAVNNVLGLVQRRNDDIDRCQPPVFCRSRRRLIGTAQESTEAQNRARTQNKIG